MLGIPVQFNNEMLDVQMSGKSNCTQSLLRNTANNNMFVSECPHEIRQNHIIVHVMEEWKTSFCLSCSGKRNRFAKQTWKEMNLQHVLRKSEEILKVSDTALHNDSRVLQSWASEFRNIRSQERPVYPTGRSIWPNWRSFGHKQIVFWGSFRYHCFASSPGKREFFEYQALLLLLLSYLFFGAVL